MKSGKSAEEVELLAMGLAWRDLSIHWQLTWSERAALFPAGGEDADRPPEDTERRMRILIEVGYRLRFDDDAEMCEWLRSPSPMWRWHAPLDVMSGSLPDLRRFRQFVELEQFA